MHITSLQNDRVKHLVRLRDDRRHRERDGLMLVEGWDEIALATNAGYTPESIISCPELTSRVMPVTAGEIITVTRPVFERISYRDNPDGWLAVFPTPQHALEDIRLGERPLVIVAEAVEKPGNIGAILRTADAAGVTAVLLSDPRTDLYGPNVVRASRGTVFTVPAASGSGEEVFGLLKQHGIRILAATPSADRLYTDQDLRGPVAIVVGTENEGLSEFWLQHADAQVLIPMSGKVNSLNVSIATALIVYEVVRQRTKY